MLLSLLAFVGRYSFNGPGWADEWGNGFVPVLVGGQPLTAEWLWMPFNGHRLVFPKLMLWILAKLTGGDFRAAMFVSAFGLGALALVMIRLATRIRGCLKYTDVIFPLALFSSTPMSYFLWPY
jgi:hypothetical protein